MVRTLECLLCCLRDLEFILSDLVVLLRNWSRALWAILKWTLLALGNPLEGARV